MALTDEKIPYEILIRFGKDGKPQGAHVQYRRLVVLDGEILKDEEQPAEPLSIDNFPASSIIGDTATSALARVNDVEGMLRQAQAAVTSERSMRQKAEGVIMDRDESIKIAAQNYAELNRDLEKAGEQVKALLARIAELEKAQAEPSA